MALQTYYKNLLAEWYFELSNITSYAKKLMDEFDVRAASEVVPARLSLEETSKKPLSF